MVLINTRSFFLLEFFLRNINLYYRFYDLIRTKRVCNTYDPIIQLGQTYSLPLFIHIITNVHLRICQQGYTIKIYNQERTTNHMSSRIYHQEIHQEYAIKNITSRICYQGHDV